MPGCRTCEELRFVTINCSIENPLLLTKETLLSSYPDRFKGLRTFKDNLTILRLTQQQNQSYTHCGQFQCTLKTFTKRN